MARNDINVRVGADITRFSSAMQNVDRGLKKTGKNVGTFGSAAKFGLAGIAIALGGVATAAVKTQAEFEAAMSKVKALTGETGAAFGQMTEKAKELGRTTPHSATAAAEGMQFLAMAGFDANQIMDSIGGTLDLASAAGIELGRSADIVSNQLSQFGLTAKDTDKVVDQLAKTTTSHNTNMEQMAEAMKFLGPTAKALKIPMSEASAVVGIMGDNGLQGSIATRALGTSLVKLAKPTKSMKEEMTRLGVEFFNAKGEFVGVAGLVEQLQGAFKGMTDKQKQAALSTLFGNEAIQEFNILLGTGSEQLREYTKEIKNSDGAANEMATTMEDNLAGDFKKLKSALEGLLLGTGAIAKGLRGVVQAGTVLVSGLADLASGTKKASSEFFEQRKEFRETTAAAKPLLDKYNDLKDKEKLTKEETQELKDVTQKLSDLYPEAITKVNEYGEALGINTGKIKDLNSEQREHLKLLNKEAIEEAKAHAERLKRSNEIAKTDIDRGFKNIVTVGSGGGISGGSTQISKVNLGESDIVDLRSKMAKNNQALAETYLELENLGAELTEQQKFVVMKFIPGYDGASEASKRLKAGVAGLNSEVDESNKKLKDSAAIIPSLRDEIVKLKEAQEKSFDEKEIKQYQVEIESLEDKLKSLTDTAEKADPMKAAFSFSGTGFEAPSNQTVDAGGGSSLSAFGEVEELKESIDILKEQQSQLIDAGDAWNDYADKIAEAEAKLAQLNSTSSDTEGITDWARKHTESVNNVATVTNGATNAVNAVSQASHDMKMGRIQAEYDAERARIEGSTMSEEDRAARMDALDKKILKKKQEVAQKRARIEKATALVSAIVNGAAAVVKALAVGPPVGIPLAIATGVVAGAQVATIASQPLPRLAEGGIVSGPSLVEVGEYQGARVNPEVIAPLDKLKTMIGGNMQLPSVIKLVADGRELRAVLVAEENGRYRLS